MEQETSPEFTRPPIQKFLASSSQEWIEALNRGKHVFCEIPIARKLEDVEEMITTANESGCLLLVALLDRFVPEFLYVREAVRSESLGRVMSVTDYKIHPPYWPQGGSLKDTTYIDPLIIEVLAFDFDYLNWLFGLPRTVSATGVIGETEKYEHVFVSLGFDSVLASIEGNILVPKNFPISNGVRVVCENGTIEANTRIMEGGLPEVSVVGRPKGGKMEEIEIKGADPYEEECKYFVECIKREASPSLLSAEAARDALRVSWAVRESLQKGKPIALD